MAILSKSGIVTGLQCEKRLFLQKHNRELADSTSDQRRNAQRSGTEVGEIARTYFPNGILVHSEFNGKKREIDQLQQTEALMQSDTPCIFEATFLWEGVIVRIDVLEKHGDAWNIYEVKASTSIKRMHSFDLAVQVFIARKYGLRIRRANIMLVNNQYVMKGQFMVKEFFVIKNLNKKIQIHLNNLGSTIHELKQTLAGEEPEISIGNHCSSPYKCEFKGHCWKHVPSKSILELCGSKEIAWDLWNQGIVAFEEVPEIALQEFSPAQRDQHQANLRGKPLVNKPMLSEFINDLTAPIHYLDFEAFSTAIPMFKGSKPYDQMAFQYSLHIQNNQDLVHLDFVADPTSLVDPRKQMIEALLNDLQEEGDILVYNLSFEKRVFLNIAKAYPEHEKEIHKVIPRLKDLIIPFKEKMVISAEMRGKTSIKNVLPALVQDMSYDGLAIQNGAAASLEFAHLIANNTTSEDTINQLKKYCEQDTLAMVYILDALKELINSKD